MNKVTRMDFYPSENQTGLPTVAEPLVKLWVLRLLIPLRGFRKRFARSDRHVDPKFEFHNLEQDFFQSLDLTFNIDPEDYLTTGDGEGDREIHIPTLFECLYKAYKSGEKTLRDAKATGCLARNVRRLSDLTGLTQTDCRILELAILIDADEFLGMACHMVDQLTPKTLAGVISVLLDLPQEAIRNSLRKDNTLDKCGLLSVNERNDLSDMLELVSNHFADNMVSSDADPVALLREVVSPASPPHLTIADFPHLEKELGILQPYLKETVTTKRKGVNILLYGDPGTGKSQLARVLAAETGCELFEVSCEDEDGESKMDWERLRAFKAAQHLLCNRNIVVLFDEIEDVFDTADNQNFARLFGERSNIRNPKAWVNRRLEENPVPTLWLGNSVDGLDPAFIRRFDMIIKMPVPPRRQRQKIIRANCPDLLSERDIERISAVETLAPAVVTRASSVVAAIGDELAQSDQSPALELIINNTLEAQGHQRIQRYDPNRLPDTYDPAFIHTDTDLGGIARGLKKTKTGRLCLYGPAGTGKTAYGRWLAEQLEVPLLVKRGSDLISMWVGGTEKNIAESFRQAETEGAILLIDEVEGFLQDRREAKHSWEVTGVNEMLTQTESFSGIFIASTNLVDNLDQAALRRFDMKIKFDYLLPRQSGALLESYCNTLNLEASDNALAARLGRLTNVTPGDFAAIMRRARFKPFHSAADVMAALEHECGLKENFKHPIGFC